MIQTIKKHKENEQHNLKWMMKLNRLFRRKIYNENKQFLKCSTTSDTREMHIKVFLRFYLTSVRMTFYHKIK